MPQLSDSIYNPGTVAALVAAGLGPPVGYSTYLVNSNAEVIGQALLRDTAMQQGASPVQVATPTSSSFFDEYNTNSFSTSQVAILAGVAGVLIYFLLKKK